MNSYLTIKQLSRVGTLLLLLALTSLPLPTIAKPKAVAPVQFAEPPPPSADIGAVRDKLKVLHDGKNHYLVLVPFGDISTHLYYGDGKAFYAQRVFGGGSQGDTAFDRVFWDPRAKARWQAGIGFRDGKYTVQCEDRQTVLTPMPATEAEKILSQAKFFDHLWSRRAYALARDQTGTYYYVDTGNRPDMEKQFRLYAGPRGSLQPLAMVNVVSDSAGDVFSTKSGNLRLILDQKVSVWHAGTKDLPLTLLPVEDNARMIYAELGVYLGKRLGTPCDDL